MLDQLGASGGFEPASEPAPDCNLCPRLHSFVADQRRSHPDWHNGPVPSFGDRNAAFLIVGLAPGLRGANRTGRPFTGDYAGDLLYQTLLKYRWASGAYRAEPDDSIRLNGVAITNAVRCVPPQNKPVGAEINTCNHFLETLIASMTALRVILALGKIAHDAVLKSQNIRRAAHGFGHNKRHELSSGLVLIDSYHCSRYNVNTGRLTEAMFETVFDGVQRFLMR